MKISATLGLLAHFMAAIRVALLPTLYAILKSPLLLFRLNELSHIFMNHVWSVFGPEIDGNSRELKQNLITPNAHGVVLDIGAGE